MKQIGTTENGDALVQMTWKEWGIYSMVDLENVIKVLDAINAVGDSVGELIDIFHAKPAAMKVSKKRGPYKKRKSVTEKTEKAEKKLKMARFIPPPEVKEKKQTLVELAIDTMKRLETPCPLQDVVDAMKARGCEFKSDNPVESLGVNLTAQKAAMVVGRDGKVGLWMIAGPDAMAKRAEYLKSIGKA